MSTGQQSSSSGRERQQVSNLDDEDVDDENGGDDVVHKDGGDAVVHNYDNNDVVKDYCDDDGQKAKRLCSTYLWYTLT